MFKKFVSHIKLNRNSWESLYAVTAEFAQLFAIFHATLAEH